MRVNSIGNVYTPNVSFQKKDKGHKYEITRTSFDSQVGELIGYFALKDGTEHSISTKCESTRDVRRALKDLKKHLPLNARIAEGVHEEMQKPSSTPKDSTVEWVWFNSH